MEDVQAVRGYLERSGWLEGIREVRFLAAGEYNENHYVRASGGEYVLRINHGSQLGLGREQIGYEFSVLSAVAPSGVTPRPYRVDPWPEGLSGGTLLMDYLPGRPLDYSHDLERAARILARVHALPPDDGLIRQDRAVLDIVAESEGLLDRYPDHPRPEMRDRLLAYRDDVLTLNERSRDFLASEPPVMVNTEVNSGNFIMSHMDGRHGKGDFLVDWEKAVVSTRHQDLGHFLAPTTTLWKTDTQLDREQREAFLSAYRRELLLLGAAAPDMDALREGSAILERTILLRALSWSHMAYCEYTRAERAIRNADTLAKIRQYLDNAECFLTWKE
ncbi:phosphotransferase family protein [Desulfocurvibacter africanus]|uniref:Aminoglycoside phosphotransferase n=1 Tax=Desulfocurvibacter africanus subsp. africanus str. Walvis Bay TaxID=690850 RepID=F3YTR5_DESAF|nr:aminoglycoside phosphotransferase family protein [Desulfocurvibacter africanus]EGJ48446.1 aminoglycoside phosphotransferase [Desulfocurvibacter africanus subsp. africanus str. Walvis Bay]